MKNIPLNILLSICCGALLLPALVWGEACKSHDVKGTLCHMNVADIRPTQFAVGAVAVSCKAEKISKKSKKKLKKYLQKEKNRMPAVIGPDGEFYITDHHHLATALYQAQSSDWGDMDKTLTMQVIDTYFPDKVSWAEFWQIMQEKNQSYNYDNKGIAYMNFALLPKTVGELLNDPYRTLSRWVRESCGYLKKGKTQCDAIRPDPAHEAPFFMEFYWGDFFREHLPLTTEKLKVCQSIPYSSLCLKNEVEQLKGIYEQAMQLAVSDKAVNYFIDQGLDPMSYGFNTEKKFVPIQWGGAENECDNP